MSLPTSIRFLTNLFDSLSSYDSVPEESHARNTSTSLNPALPSNPLLKYPHQTETLKQILTTLHLLFPNELLPALDLLDRSLVTKLVLLEPTTEGTQTENKSTAQSFYIVRSSATAGRNQQFSPRRGDQESRHQNNSRGMSYEVRLTAWNCTCPALAFDVVNSLSGATEVWNRGEDQEEELHRDVNAEWVFGGLRALNSANGSGSKIPCCKHLLACLLVERCPLLRDSLTVKRVSNEEMAGWSAGWGD